MIEATSRIYLYSAFDILHYRYSEYSSTDLTNAALVLLHGHQVGYPNDGNYGDKLHDGSGDKDSYEAIVINQHTADYSATSPCGSIDRFQSLPPTPLLLGYHVHDDALRQRLRRINDHSPNQKYGHYCGNRAVPWVLIGRDVLVMPKYVKLWACAARTNSRDTPVTLANAVAQHLPIFLLKLCTSKLAPATNKGLSV